MQGKKISFTIHNFKFKYVADSRPSVAFQSQERTWGLQWEPFKHIQLSPKVPLSGIVETPL